MFNSLIQRVTNSRTALNVLFEVLIRPNIQKVHLMTSVQTQGRSEVVAQTYS